MTRIMIVEDNVHARRALKALLSQQDGFAVCGEASNGQEAIRNIKDKTPDIVLMDMRMPVMDGFEATKIIKSIWPQMGVIAMTMYPDCKAEAFSAGADAFLIKGCSLEEITFTIHSIIKSHVIPGDFRSVKNIPSTFYVFHPNKMIK